MPPRTTPPRRWSDQWRRAHEEATPLDRESYRRWLADQPMRRQMRDAPDGYVYPCVIVQQGKRPPRRKGLSAELRRDIVALVQEGWWPFDVAVAYGVPIYKREPTPRNPSRYGSKIYEYVQLWEREE